MNKNSRQPVLSRIREEELTGFVIVPFELMSPISGPENGIPSSVYQT